MTREKLKGTPFESWVNVAQLLKEPVGSSRSYDIDDVLAEQVVGSVEGKIMLIRSSQGILVRGELTVKVELMCSRCLNPFFCPISFNIEEEFFSTVDVSSGLPLSLPEEANGFTIDGNHMLNLSKLIRQYVLLNLPMKPLCRPDCAGMKEISSYGST
jgi:Predicted metal-binding, possibly nucleic acid-binding protein